MNCTVFVISLARATDRRADIKRRLDAASVSYEITDAVDGRELDVDALKHRISADLKHLRSGKVDFTANELGCLLSHCNLWRRIVDEQIPFALILEDDCEWDDDLFAIANAVVASKFYWNIVHLSAQRKRKPIATIEQIGKRALVRLPKAEANTDCYLIDFDGAKKMETFYRVIRDNTDRQWKHYWQSGCYFYHIIPPPARQSGSASLILHNPRKKTRHVMAEMGSFRYLHHIIKSEFSRLWFHRATPRKLR